MAKTTEFSHDTLAHLLQDKRLVVPDFQRAYAWDVENVNDYWFDITRAHEEENSYFLGTVVLSDVAGRPGWHYIVDGQQRITTTALTILAIHRKLRQIGKEAAAGKIFNDHIADFDLDEEETVPRLVLSPSDNAIYEQLVDGERSTEELLKEVRKAKGQTRLIEAFVCLESRIADFVEGTDEYFSLVSLKRFLNDEAQVLLAIASGLSEAYVIFETLNDRGADLTTADLLKNYFLSAAGEKRVNEAKQYWTELSDKFDKSEQFIAFIKSHYTSKWGQVKSKSLYDNLQEKLGKSSSSVVAYLAELKKSYPLYEALSNPEAGYWADIATDVRDDVIANRRFRLEMPFSLYLAAGRSWKPKDLCALISAGTAWSIRASVVGILGGGTAEKVYATAAELIASGALKSVSDVREHLIDSNFIPSDSQFKAALMSVTDSRLSRMKYFLAMIEKRYWISHEKNTEAFPAWDAKTVSVEHIIADSADVEVSADGKNSTLREYQHALPNLALLERNLNNSIGDDDFASKKSVYEDSAFQLTRELSSYRDFDDQAIEERKEALLELACEAWPI